MQKAKRRRLKGNKRKTLLTKRNSQNKEQKTERREKCLQLSLLFVTKFYLKQNLYLWSCCGSPSGCRCIPTAR